MGFDRFAICEAYYLYALLYHEGQFSDTYRIFGRLEKIGFRPSSCLANPDKLEESAREIFDNLVARSA